MEFKVYDYYSLITTQLMTCHKMARNIKILMKIDSNGLYNAIFAYISSEMQMYIIICYVRLATRNLNSLVSLHGYYNINLYNTMAGFYRFVEWIILCNFIINDEEIVSQIDQYNAHHYFQSRSMHRYIIY